MLRPVWSPRPFFLRRTFLGPDPFLLLAFALLLLPPAGADEVFDAAGFNRNRDYFSQLSHEHVDPMTGNLLLTFTDLVLPGNGGFELRIQRTYNSKIYRNYAQGQTNPAEDTWAGVGWTLHVGRVPDPALTNAQPPLEMPDGSRHPLYHHVDGSGRFITREFWVYDRNTHSLQLPNGVVYTFGKSVTLPDGQIYRYTTHIEDPFGNTIDVEYMNPALGQPADGIARITQSIADPTGNKARTIHFTATTDTLRRLQSMTFDGRTWTYTQVASQDAGYSLLTAVTPPVGRGWGFTYHTATTPRYELIKVTTPYGGEMGYLYDDQVFYLGSTVPARSRVVVRRTTGGRDVPSGTWAYAYGQGSGQNQTVITGPCERTVHSFSGIGDFTATGAAWRVGLLTRKEVFEGATLLQAEDLTWRPGAPISNDREQVGNNLDPQTYVPLLESRRITRGTRTYSTTYTYRPTRLNDYGRPATITEAGELARTATRDYTYGFQRYIVDKLGIETATVGGESFTRSYTYDLATGFKRSETLYGIGRSFAPDAWGNVAGDSDANNHTRHYEHTWGRVSRVVSPLYDPLLTREINSDGTVHSETRRGFTTTFQYDALSRPTLTTPPVGNPTVTEYDNASPAEYVRVKRGPSLTDTLLDGYGRVSGSQNGVGIRTDVSYDACGRRIYESLPFTGTANTGTSFTYDGLGRLKLKANPDGTGASYAYTNGIDVTFTNERLKKTFSDFSAFGDPEEPRLVALRDADDRLWSYGYNALGNLTLVDPQGLGGQRTWTYNASNLLEAESQPETGTLRYTYDAAGRLKTRTDPAFGVTVFTYDADDRLTLVDRPGGTAYDISQEWDASNNRTRLANGFVTSSFDHDGSNRPLSRTDAVGGKIFRTGYDYDGNDNLRQLDYPPPSGLSVSYSYDSENRLTDVRPTGSPTAHAHSFGYHPSGAPLTFTTGNGEVHRFTYDRRHRVETMGTGVLALEYKYDGVGNVEAILDSRPGMNQSFSYDAVDRLQTANGFWGSGAFSYDALGNRTGKTVGGLTLYSYDGPTGRLASVSGVGADSFTYDPNGNLKTSAVGAYSYTPENMMEAATVGDLTTIYRYDGDQIRKVKTSGGRTSFFVHDLAGQILAEFEEPCPGAALLSVRSYVHAGGRLLASVRPAVGPVTLTMPIASTASEAAGTHSVAVSLSTADGLPLPCEARVSFSTSDRTAVAGRDYAATSGTLVFPQGAASGTIRPVPLTLVNDTLDEDDETLTLQLSSPLGAVLGNTTHTVTIADDDPAPTVSLTPLTQTAAEGNVGLKEIALDVQLSALSGKTITVTYATADGTATAGSDYQPKTATLTFPAESTSRQSIAFKLISDTLVETDEDFSVSITGATNATASGGPARILIPNDDSPRPPEPPRSNFNGDAQADILWHHQTRGELFVWLMNGTLASSSSSHLTPSLFPDTTWQIRGLVDLNHDGETDLLWHNQTTGDLYVWFMSGTVFQSGSYLTPRRQGDLQWQIRGLTDFDADGKQDILWHNQATGDLFVWLLDDTVVKSGVLLEPSRFADTRWQIRGLADFDGDRQADILWHNQATGELFVWFLGGTTATRGSFLTPSRQPDTNWQIRVVADFNEDGKPDILWHHQTTGDLYVWFLDGTTATSGSYLTPRRFADTLWQIVPR